MLSAQHNSDKTVSVRLISDTEKSFQVPSIIQRFFETNKRVQSQKGDQLKTIDYKSKAIALFQTIDGLDVCIFCMYVQEYSSPEKRVYVAYLDSVEYFRPPSLRTVVYQEMITSYLATTKKRGFTNAHIWACPPLRGNSFIFWNHLAGQRTPTMERLTSWYNRVLSRAIEVGVVSNVISLYESDFEQPMAEICETVDDEMGRHSKMPCPPLLEGDFWIEEALRLYQTTAHKHAKESTSSSTSPSSASVEPSSSLCPAVCLAGMLRDRIISHPSSLAFRRPVNAAALKIPNYHDVIQEPMDLGTVFTKLSLGEYETLCDLVADIELLFNNAMKFNHSSNAVHMQAVELREIFFRALDDTTKTWRGEYVESAVGHSWRMFGDMSLSLSHSLNTKPLSTLRNEFKEHSLSPNNCPARNLDCASSDSIHLRMMGKDVDLFERKTSYSAKKQKRQEICPPPFQDSRADQRRRQTWLGEHVGRSVRRLRTSLFNCFLQTAGEHADSEAFVEYCELDSLECSQVSRRSRVADTRHGFLEFSQLRNLEYDTLRKAKYSTAIMLYHLHCDEAPGVCTACSLCAEDLDKVRWHFIGKLPLAVLKGGIPEGNKDGRNICGTCFANCANKSHYIPIPVSI
jgi:Histone acetylation protein/Bromodomain